MIITSTKKKKPTKIENIQKLIDSAGETQFKNIYKNLQVEIKDKIITKLLSKLDKQKKQIEEYKQEILSLKNDLVYLLKRIILSKNELKLNSQTSKIKRNYNNLIKNSTSSWNNYNTSAFSPNNSLYQIKSPTNLYNQTESNNPNNKLSFDLSNISPNQNEFDIKIINYINSIYRHNFLKNETNINEYYSLNKTENLFEEIFIKRSNKKNNDLYMGTDPCINKKNKLHNNHSQRNISSSLTKRKIESIDDRKKNKKLSSSMINIKNNDEYNEEFEDNQEDFEDENEEIKCKTNGKINIIIKNNNYGNKYLKVKKKSGEINTHNSQLNNYKSFKNKTQHNGFYQINNANKINNNTTLKKKIKRNNHYIPLNRSPFLANKF